MKTVRPVVALPNSSSARDLMPLKVLNRLLVFPGCRLCLERAQIPTLSSFRIFLSRIQPIFAGLEFPDHAAWILIVRLAGARERLLRCFS
jgi:hypothetical protein